MTPSLLDRIPDEGRRVALVIEQATGVSAEAIVSRSRLPRISAARRCCYHLLTMRGIGSTEAGAALGRNHTSVLRGMATASLADSLREACGTCHDPGEALATLRRIAREGWPDVPPRPAPAPRAKARDAAPLEPGIAARIRRAPDRWRVLVETLADMPVAQRRPLWVEWARSEWPLTWCSQVLMPPAGLAMVQG